MNTDIETVQDRILHGLTPVTMRVLNRYGNCDGKES